MKRVILSMAMLFVMAATLVACGGSNTVQPAALPTSAPVENTPMQSSSGQSNAGQDQHITVQHILIGFKDAVGFQGNPPPKAATRTQEQAKTLAYDLLSKAKSGANFDQLVIDNTDDSPPGIYKMSNTGITPSSADEYSRDSMVPAFGNVGFALKVGEIGISDYDPAASPFGYHIIKRIK
ncbi:MAG: peptidylprolyl isomerase [Chloroflexi bacterium]|nr:peptidylprolyl isomerase [Chloroflexota bacterium]